MKFTVYDFDKTIYDGDSSVDFIIFCIKKNKKILKYCPKMLISLIKYKLNLITKEKMKECFFGIVSYSVDMDLVIKEFWQKNEYKLKAFFIQKKNHKNDIIASAGPKFLIEPIAKKYKVKDLFGSNIDKNTGKYDGINCHGVEKVNVINKKYPECIIEEMYSDDIKADKPLLDIANKSYVVKKNTHIDYKDYLRDRNIIKKNYNRIIKIYKKNEEIYNYLIVGGLTTLVSLITYYICVSTIFNPNISIELQISNILSWITSVIFAYITNRRYVYKSKEKNIKKEMTYFVGSRVITLLLDMLIMFLWVTTLNLNDKIGKIISQILIIIGNYIISKLIVFKKK